MASCSKADGCAPVADSNEATEAEDISDTLKISVSRTAGEAAEGGVVSPVRSRRHKFCRWFKRKFWCIRGNSVMESPASGKSSGSQQEKLSRTAEGDPVDDSKNPNPRESKKSKAEANDRTVHTTNVVADRKVSKEKKPRERQVTFSDTVRTHIKTKYVSAEEYKQIRGMNPNSRRIAYQILKLNDNYKIQSSNENRNLPHRGRKKK